MPEIRKNETKRGIEISFEAKPDAEVIKFLKDLKYKWSPKLKIWYKRFGAQRTFDAGADKAVQTLQEFFDQHKQKNNDQLVIGIEIEKEHTSDPEVAKKIALDHLKENPNYYSDPKPANWAEKELKEEAEIKKIESDQAMQEVQQEMIDEGKGKEPWEMTSAEYRASIEKAVGKPLDQFIDEQMEYHRKNIHSVTRNQLESLYNNHKEIIIAALSEGKVVPANVLAEYPELNSTKLNIPIEEKTKIRKQLLREQDGLKIYLVDGEEVRKDRIMFVSGGHGYVYDWIPRDEVWIDDNQKDKPDDMEATITHELFEIGKMRDEGLSYDDAHELANAVEKKERNNEPMEPEPIESEEEEIRESREMFGYVFDFNPPNEEGSQLISSLKGINLSPHTDPDDSRNELRLTYKDNEYLIFDNSGEFKIDNKTTHKYINQIDFKSESGFIKNIPLLAHEIKETILTNIDENIPVALPVVMDDDKEYFVDFKLQELRDVHTAERVPFAVVSNLNPELAAKIRAIRAEFGPNVHIEGLDVPEKSAKTGFSGIDAINAIDTESYQYWFERYSAWGKSEVEEVWNKYYAEHFKDPDFIKSSNNRFKALVDIATKRGIVVPKTSESFPKKTISVSPSDYSNPFDLNKAIEALLDKKWNDKPESWSEDELEFIKGYSGYGGLDEYGQIDKGSLFEFYTPEAVIEKMWGLAYKHGYNEGRLCEPSVAKGDFLKREYVKSMVQKDAYEINKFSAKICKLLYPEVSVNAGKESMYFEQVFIKNNYTIRDKYIPMYDLVIGNPPYGEAQSMYLGMGEKAYTHAKNYIDYFIFRGLDLLMKDGLLIYIIGAEVAAGGKPWLDSGPSKCKEMIEKKGKLIDAYRLPEGVFARTNVVSDIVVFKKR